ncbi:MAG: T9SS type A sorting domain-containing protein [Chitinophagales bacterium]
MDINTCFGVCADTTNPPTVDMTFNVNMINQNTSPDGVYFAGGITFGQPGDIPMLDPDGDDIYSVTLTLPTGLRDYHTFTNGNCPGDFSCKEQLGGQACASPEFFNDRLLIVPATDQTLDVCFGLCTEDGSCSIPTSAVTFQVDMTSQDVNPTGVFMGSNIDGWSGGIALADADGDGIYSVTIDLLEGAYEYKFINGAGWVDGGESVPVACDVTGGAFQNRGVTVGSEAIVLDPVCFGACTVECPQVIDVTFRVNMALEDVNPGGVYMGSNIDGWSGNIALSQLGTSDIWTVTIPLAVGDYEYKFINGPGWVDGGESVPLACDVTGGAFQNRGVSVVAGTPTMLLPNVCFSSCEACPRIGCTDSDSHNYSPRAELDPSQKTFYWDDVNFIDASVNSAYCSTPVTHFAGDAPSEILLTVTNVDATTVEVIVESADADPVDLLIIVGGSGASISAEDMSVPGQIKRTMTWATPPTDITLNLLWSKASFGGNWQLSQGDVMIPFAASCTPPVDPTATSSPYCDTEVTHFAGDAPSKILLTLTNVDASTMEVIIESADADPVDLLIVVGGSGSTVSAEDMSVPGQIKRTLTWATPPVNVALNILWSKASFGGNWQLSQGDIMIPFTANCTPGSADSDATTGVFPITFDDPNVNYDLVDFGGNISAIVTDPTDPTNMVVETTKTPLAQVWAGTTAGGAGLSSPIPFTGTSTKMSVRVWSPQTGVNVLLKVENAGNGGIFIEAFANTTVAGDWETLTFDFAPVNLNNIYNKVSIFFDFGTAYPESLCETCYDGIQNGDEEGIDCGGTNPNCVSCDLGCTDMYAHNYNAAASIDDGSCETCYDNIMNGDEEAVDCGGALCAPCLMGCTDEGAHNYDPLADVDNGSCETCGDGVMNGDELGYDCGGALCDACMSVSVGAVLNIPASGPGTGSIDAIVTGGDTSCGTLTYSWTGPGGYAATTEDISNITEAGAYMLEVTDCLGNIATMTVNVATRTRGRGRKASIISDALFQASPNPFGQETILSFNLAVEGNVSLEVYDISGKRVSVLFDGNVEAEKDYQFQFGNDLVSGTYIATLTAASGDVKHIKLVVTH